MSVALAHRARIKTATSNMFCCCGGSAATDGSKGDRSSAGKYEEVHSPETAKRSGGLRSPSSRAVDNAPGGGAPSPTAASPSVGSDDEFHDAEDTLESLDASKWGPSMKTAGAFLAEAGIVLETRDAPKTGIGRCVIPRKDIPFGNPEAGQALSWSANPQGRGFKLRGKNYLKDRKKYPSATPLFDVVEVLALRSDAQTLDMGDIIYGGDVGEVVHGCPTVYIANLMLPDYPPLNPVWGKYDRVKGPDGPGQHICVVARMAAETRAELERANGDVSKMSPDVALMARHFRANDGADADGLDAPPHAAPERHCTKMVCMVAAGQEELPWAVRVAIGQGNGKPFMVNKTGFFTRRPGKGYFEIGVNAHNFGPVATNGLRNCHNFFKRLTLDIGVTLQGGSEEELPERLLFAFRAIKPDLESVVVHVNELEAEAKRVGKGRDARPWLNWGGLGDAE